MTISADTSRLLTALDNMPIIGYVSSHSGYFNADKSSLKEDDFETAVSLVRQSDALREIDQLRKELRIKSEEHDCCSEDIQRLRAAVIGILEIETERIKTGEFKPNPEAQRRIDAAWAAL